MTLPELEFKYGIKINGRHFDPEIRRILDVVRLTAPPMLAQEIYVTSANDGGHKEGSKHFTDEAFDIRIRNVKDFKWGVTGDFIYNDIVNAWVRQIALELGSDYDVVYGDKNHLSHIHIEYDPKKTGGKKKGKKKAKKPTPPVKTEAPKTETPKPAAPKATPKPKPAPKPKGPSPAEVKAAKSAGRKNLQGMPEQGPKKAPFRMTPAPSPTERAQAKNVGASLKAHVRGAMREKAAAAAPKPSGAKVATGKLGTRISGALKARRVAAKARSAAHAERGLLGRTAGRIGQGYRATKLGAAVLGAVDWVKTGSAYAGGKSAHSGLIKQAGVIKDTGYRATIKKPTLGRMLRGMGPGLTIEKTGKLAKKRKTVKPPRLPRL
jgi:hypothetical protein